MNSVDDDVRLLSDHHLLIRENWLFVLVQGARVAHVDLFLEIVAWFYEFNLLPQRMYSSATRLCMIFVQWEKVHALFLFERSFIIIVPINLILIDYWGIVDISASTVLLLIDNFDFECRIFRLGT